jgi:hypothetical protein
MVAIAQENCFMDERADVAWCADCYFDLFNAFSFGSEICFAFSALIAGIMELVPYGILIALIPAVYFSYLSGGTGSALEVALSLYHFASI